MADDKLKISFDDIPEFERNQLVRATVEACKKFYSDPKNVERFEKWKAERDKKSKEVQDDGTILKEDET